MGFPVSIDKLGTPIEFKAEQVQPTAAGYMSITKFDLPASVSPNQLFAFSVNATCKRLPPYPWGGAGIAYIDGPTSSVTIIVNGVETTFSKGEGKVYLSPVQVGTVVGVGVYGQLSTPGKYRFQAVSAYCFQQDTTIYWDVDEEQYKEIEVTAPTVPKEEENAFGQITKMLQEQLLPMMMSMMMLMMMMSMMSSLMASMREAFKKE